MTDTTAPSTAATAATAATAPEAGASAAAAVPRIALITGGSRGLGRSMALALAAQGADILLTYRSNRAEAEAVVAAVEARGRRAAALPLDVGASAGFGDFAAAVARQLAAWGRARIDCLVNNAGVGAFAPFAETTERQFDEMVAVHLKGAFFLTQKLLPLIADGGRILNVSSGLARFSYPGYAAYAVMKGGVEVLTRYLAVELGPRGIAVNTLAPGAIETDFGGGAVRDDAALNARIAQSTPLGRVGLPEDIGGAVAALLSDGGRWINGQRIEVAGGIHG
jgi:NAD(P)-dependent dehydrogenase (short-subunit alcohol dehydrogenase family)